MKCRREAICGLHLHGTWSSSRVLSFGCSLDRRDPLANEGERSLGRPTRELAGASPGTGFQVSPFRLWIFYNLDLNDESSEVSCSTCSTTSWRSVRRAQRLLVGGWEGEEEGSYRGTDEEYVFVAPVEDCCVVVFVGPLVPFRVSCVCVGVRRDFCWSLLMCDVLSSEVVFSRACNPHVSVCLLGTSLTTSVGVLIWFLFLCSAPREKEGLTASHMLFEDAAMDSRTLPVSSGDGVEREGHFAPKLLSNASVHLSNLVYVDGWTPLVHVPEEPHRFDQ